MSAKKFELLTAALRSAFMMNLVAVPTVKILLILHLMRGEHSTDVSKLCFVENKTSIIELNNHSKALDSTKNSYE
jgi:hypothetical protein